MKNDGFMTCFHPSSSVFYSDLVPVTV